MWEEGESVFGHAVKACGGNGGMAPHVLNFGTAWR